MRIREQAFVGGKIITPWETIDPGTLVVRGRTIYTVGPEKSVDVHPDSRIIDVRGKIIAPGFVELHIHGYSGVMMGSLDDSPMSPTNTIGGDILHVARMLPQTGITSFLPTLLISSDLTGILKMLSEAAEVIDDNNPGAHILGLHMEGPYFSTAPRGQYDRYPPGGAISLEFARRPSFHELLEMMKAARFKLQMMSLSPEIEGALGLIRELVSMGVVASGAHSFANYQQFMQAVDAGMTMVTHMYNGMRHQAHRDPGIIEAALTSDRVITQVITDGVHVHAPALEIVLRCKGKERIAITTDNTAWAGMPNGQYRDSHGRELLKTDEYVELVGGPLYGSVAPMNQQIRTLIECLNLPMNDAVGMATVIPARSIGIEQRKGSLEAGKDADIVIMDEDFQVRSTFCRGRKVFSA